MRCSQNYISYDTKTQETHPRTQQSATHTWSTGFKFDALRRAPAEASVAGLLALTPKREIIFPAEAIVLFVQYVHNDTLEMPAVALEAGAIHHHTRTEKPNILYNA